MIEGLKMIKEMENIMKLDNNHLNVYKKQHKIVSGAIRPNSSYLIRVRSKIVSFFSINLLLLALIPAVMAQQTQFPTAQAAADKLYEIVLAKDASSVKALFGAENLHLLPLDEIDDQDRVLFINAWKKSHQLIAGAKDEMFIEVGMLGWTFPVPLVKNNDAWSFDTIAGAEIILTRRIGRNELSTMQACMAYYDAQNEYAEQDRNTNGALEYAQKFMSTPGKKDGLYWQVDSGEITSPLGSLFSGDTSDGAYHGYYYKILKGQGKNARGGAYSYLSDERMRSGFALVAWPAEYGESGVISFIINQDGILYEKDLGSDTAQLAAEMKLFEPGEDWLRAEEKL